MRKLSKENAIDSMQITLHRSRNLALEFRFYGDDTSALKLEKKNKELSKLIDKLIIAAVENWLLDAKKVTANIKKSNTSLQRSITSIKKKKNIGDNLVKALGLVDDVISIAKTLLPG